MRSRLIVAAVTLFAIASVAGAAATRKKKAPSHSNTVRATYSPAPGTSAKTRGKSSTTARRKGRRKAYAARRGPARQLAPTPERYMEIQKALADRGYLKAPPSGVWDSTSQDAMRAFQNDQKLDATGKLTAASLIALGLGAKRDSPVLPEKPEAAPRPPDSVLLPLREPSPAPEQ